MDLLQSVHSDEVAALALYVVLQDVQRRADGSGFAAVRMHEDLRLSLVEEVAAHEIHLGFDHGEVALRAALQEEAASEVCDVGNSGYIEKNIFRQHRGQSGDDLLRLPALALKVHDVGLQEDSAAVAEDRHLPGRESHVGKVVDGDSQRFGGGLQKIAVSGRALSVQAEVFHRAVLQDDDLDVLPADVNDRVDIGANPQGGLGVGHGFHQRGVGVEDPLQKIARVAGGGGAENFQPHVSLGERLAELLHHGHGVRDRVGAREPISAANYVSVAGETDGLGGGGAAVDAKENLHGTAAGSGAGMRGLE